MGEATAVPSAVTKFPVSASRVRGSAWPTMAAAFSASYQKITSESATPTPIRAEAGASKRWPSAPSTAGFRDYKAHVAGDANVPGSIMEKPEDLKAADEMVDWLLA